MSIDFKPFCRLIPALLLVALPSALFAETSVDSTTIMRFQQDTHAGFQTKTLIPLTQFFGLDLDKLGDGNLSAHFYGWGRVDLADQDPTVDGGGGGRTDGALNYGYLQYRFNNANARARAGRFSITEGILNEQVDGASLRSDLPYGFGVSAFGGANVHSAKVIGANTDGKGDGIFGGRVNYRKGGFLELGLSGVYESDAPVVTSPAFLPGTFGNHRLVGGDIWLRPFDMVQLSGHTSYNTETGKVAEHSYLLQVTPLKDLVVAATYDEHHDRDFFYSSLLFADMVKNLGQESRVFGASATYTLPHNVEVSGDYKHYKRDIGQADRFGGEVRGNFLENTLKGGFDYHYLRSSADFAIVPVAGASGSYHETRAWAMHDTKSYFASVDVIGYFFKKEVEGKSTAWETLGSLGYHITPRLALSGDLSYGQNPQYDNELKGLLRLTYNLNLPGKGDRK